jgi:hypothetical protein
MMQKTEQALVSPKVKSTAKLPFPHPAKEPETAALKKHRQHGLIRAAGTQTKIAVSN